MTTKPNKASRALSLAGMGAVLLSLFFAVGTPLTAMANDRPEEEAESESEPEYEESVVKEDAGESDHSPFSIPGNAELLDDAKNDDTKEFLTVQTKNNQTYFVVIDRAANTNNVYMLSMIDENDLAEFLEEEEGGKTGLKLPATEEKTEEQLQAEEEEKREREAMMEQQRKQDGIIHTAMYATGFILILIAVCGLYYYLKFYKPRKDEENAASENLEDPDDFWADSLEVNEDDEEQKNASHGYAYEETEQPEEVYDTNDSEMEDEDR